MSQKEGREMMLTEEAIGEIQARATRGDRSVVTEFFMAMCVKPENLLDEHMPTLEWGTHPWVIALDRAFHQWHDVSLARWAELAHGNRKIDPVPGLMLIAATPIPTE